MSREQFERLKSNMGANQKFKSKEDPTKQGRKRDEDELDESWKNEANVKEQQQKTKDKTTKAEQRQQKKTKGKTTNTEQRQQQKTKGKTTKTEERQQRKTKRNPRKGDDGTSGKRDVPEKEDERMANLRREVEELEKTERELRAKGHFKDADGNPQEERVCPPHLFECGSKECILPTSKCDNEEDCADGSDEADCPKGGNPLWKCPHNLFTCKNKECILQHYRCDGKKNCTDGSDEKNCDEQTVEEKKKWNAKFAKLNQGKRRRVNWDEL
jgi:hypothetical protein